MESKERFVHIQEFMVRDLALTGNELIAYAIIYGYSQNGDGCFYGSAASIGFWCGCSNKTVYRVLKSLTEKNLVTKRDTFRDGKRVCEYQAVIGTNRIETKCPEDRDKMSQPLGQNVPTGRDKMSHENEGVSKGKKKSNRSRNEPIPPKSRQECIDYAREMHPSVDGGRFWDYYAEGDWYDSKGNPVRNWKLKMNTWDNGGNQSSHRNPKVEKEPELVRLPYGMMPESLVKTEEEIERMTQFQRDCYYHNARTYQRDWEAEHGSE